MEIKDLILNSKNITIIPHVNPDGDALGSSLALYLLLKQRGLNVVIISPDKPGNYLSWLPDYSVIKTFEESEQIVEQLKTTDLFFNLDHNSLKRCGEIGKYIEQNRAKKIMIDHHPYPDDFADYKYSEVEKCATCEITYNFIKDNFGIDAITKDIATCLYTGIITDTGALSYNSSDPNLFLIVAELLSKGIDKPEIHNNLFNNNSLDRFKLMGFCIKDKLKVIEEIGCAYIVLSSEELKKYNYKEGDTEGFVNMPLTVSGINVSVLVIEKKDIIKLSFRSLGDIEVNGVAEKYFNGGGHKNAAGGRTTESLEDCIMKLEVALSEIKA